MILKYLTIHNSGVVGSESKISILKYQIDQKNNFMFQTILQ